MPDFKFSISFDLQGQVHTIRFITLDVCIGFAVTCLTEWNVSEFLINDLRSGRPEPYLTPHDLL